MQDQTLLKLSLVVNLGFLVLASLAFLRPPPPPPQYAGNGFTENKIEQDAYNCANSIEEVKRLMTDQAASVQTMYDQLKQQECITSCPSTAPLPTYQDRKSYSCDTPEITYCEQFGGFDSWNFQKGKQSPDLCTYLHCIKQTGHLFGVNTPVGAETNGMGMFALGPADLTFLDFVIAQHQELINITEFGTASGLTSAYLGMICKIRGGEMHTFDWVSGIRCNEAHTLWDDKYMKFIQADLLSTTNVEAKASLQRGPLFAFMDNGRKKQEINVYARYLPVKSILLTHDWGVEIFLDDIKDELKNRGFIPIYEQLAVVLGANTRAWYRDSAGPGGVAQ